MCIVNNLYFGYWLGSLGNLLMASCLTYDGKAYTIVASLVTKKRQMLNTFLHSFHSNKLLSLLLGLIFQNRPSDIYILRNSKYAKMCK